MYPVLYSFIDVLGELDYSQAILANQRPFVDVVGDGKVVETIHKDADDHIMVQGQLKSGAVASISVRIVHYSATDDSLTTIASSWKARRTDMENIVRER